MIQHPRSGVMKTLMIRPLTRGFFRPPTHRTYSSEAAETLSEGFLHRTGDHPYGSRKYHLVRKAPSLDTKENDATLLPGPKGMNLKVMASLCANRNIVFGASVVATKEVSSAAQLATVVSPLLQSALTDCASVGEQPQALSTLHGLCSYVQKSLSGEIASEYLQNLEGTSAPQNHPVDGDRTASNNSEILEAVQAIATGVPRPGHSVVGVGTHKVAAAAWEALAKEFLRSAEHNTSEESRLYQQQTGAQLVGIELLADTSPDYVRSAGGAMARFFFV